MIFLQILLFGVCCFGLGYKLGAVVENEKWQNQTPAPGKEAE